MLNHLLSWGIDVRRRRNRTRSVILLSLILHMIFAITYLFLPINQLSQDQADAFAVDLINDADAPTKRKLKPKPPLTKKMYNPNEELARDAMEKQIESARNKVDEVMKLSPRVVLKDVEVNKAPVSEVIPDVMTDAQLRDAEASNLSKLIAQPGQTDGRGIVTGGSEHAATVWADSVAVDKRAPTVVCSVAAGRMVPRIDSVSLIFLMNSGDPKMSSTVLMCPQVCRLLG